MGLFHLFWDMEQDRKIRDAENAARQSATRSKAADADVAELRSAVDRLSLANQAMWELLRERTELTDADLQSKIEEVDKRDGSSDGQMSRDTEVCSSCRRPNAAGRGRCLYCGASMSAGAR